MTRDDYRKRIARYAEEIWRLGRSYESHVYDFAMDWAYSMSTASSMVVLESAAHPPNGKRLKEQLDNDVEWSDIVKIMGYLAVLDDLTAAVEAIDRDRGEYDPEQARKRWFPR